MEIFMKTARIIVTVFTALGVLASSELVSAQSGQILYQRDFVQMWKNGERSFSLDDDGWQTYCETLNGNGSADAAENKMSMQSGGIVGGGRYKRPGVEAVYNTELIGRTCVMGQNYGMNLKLSFWFNARFNGLTPMSGFYFRYYYPTENNAAGYKTELVYKAENGAEYRLKEWNADWMGKRQTFTSGYKLEFDGESTKLTLENKTYPSAGVFESETVSLKAALEQQGITDYNRTGRFALVGEAGYGRLQIENITIKSEPKISLDTDSVSVLDGGVYAYADCLGEVSSYGEAAAAVYDPDGVLIGMAFGQKAEGKDGLEFHIKVGKDTLPSGIRLFLVGSDMMLTPCDISTLYEIEQPSVCGAMK